MNKKKLISYILYLESSLGFTLVEMLAVMVVFITIGGIIVSILVTSFRTSHKTDTLTLVKQNGNYALTQIAKTIRNARAIITPYPCYPPVSSNTISITTADNNNITYICTGSTIASNGASLLDTTAVTITSCSFTCTQQFETDLPFIAINFSLNQVGSSQFAEQKASASAIPFQTSVLIRNINR